MAISAMVAWVPFSSISRQRNARVIALTTALSVQRLEAAQEPGVPSGARTTGTLVDGQDFIYFLGGGDICGIRAVL